MTAYENIGPHLLGRKPNPADDRDYKLQTFLSTDPLDVALASLLKSSTSRATKVWAQIATQRIEGLVPSPIQPTPVPPTPIPTPTPVPPANSDVIWSDADSVLDQGQTPHCVGFGWAQWGNTLPVDDHFANADGDKLYYECKVIDGEPKQEDGSDVRSGAKAMTNRGRLVTYAFATSIDEIRAWLQKHGPVVMGTDWTNDMFNPDTHGFIKPTGGVAGGHCYVAVGDLISEGAILYQNSWGPQWGQSGRFKMTYADAAKLFASQGDACVAIELG